MTTEPAEPSIGLDGSVDPRLGTAVVLAELLAELVGAEQVSIDQHFFDDLGADSMVMARFCARVRKRADLSPVSMKDIYRHPTIRSLANALPAVAPTSTRSPVPLPTPAPAPSSTPQYLFCGALQLLIFLGYSCLLGLVAARASDWISAGSGVLDTYLRSVVAGAVGFGCLCAVPILAKWLLIGRWKPGEFRVWSVAYVRFWVVKILIRSNPLVLFVGSPLYVLYLRALGARVGRGVVILSRNVPVCTDLLTIGDGTVIRQDSFFSCYRAHAGWIQTGAVTLGKDVFVGEATVLDIETALGDGAQLGRSSSLHAGQVVPAGQRWHGSPARRTDVDYRAVGPARCGSLRKISYVVGQLLAVLLLYVPLGIGGVALLFAEVPQLTVLRTQPLAYTGWVFYTDALAASFVLFFGAVLIGLLVAVSVPRLLNRTLEPDRVYPLYGFHYGVHRTIVRLTNIKFFTRIFGDSSYIVHYLRSLGYDLSRVQQTGSNFGTDVRHEIPYLCSVGSGTMVADGLSFINTEYSSTSFRVARTTIGPRNFLGNRIAYPAGGRTGANCLLATKVMVPIDGPVREGVGLLGSPPFEIPRSVDRDSRFDRLKSPDELRRRLAAKNKHNVVTLLLFLCTRWMYVYGLILMATVGVGYYDSYDAFAIAGDIVLTPLFTVAYFVLIERIETAFHALRPLYCSIYERNFWRHERYWKVPAEAYLQAFNGTPFKNLVWRLLGVRVGRRVFDDGCAITERALGAIGDDCTLNVGSVIQCHSQEDGTFKSDRTTIGSGCTLGVGAFVHYGVTMGDAAVLAPDSFLMKGEEIPPHARWGGNPARDLRDEPGSRAVRIAVLPGPTPDGRGVQPVPGGRWTIAARSVLAASIMLVVALDLLAIAPWIGPAAWDGVLPRIATAAWDGVLPRIATAAEAVGGGLGSAVNPTTVLLVAVAALALLVAVVIDVLTAGARWLRRAVFAAVLATIGVAAVAPAWIPSTPAADRIGLTNVIAVQLDPTAASMADPVAAAQLMRAGMPAQRPVPAGTLGSAPSSVPPAHPSLDPTAARRVVGSRLADDKALTLGPVAATALRTGQVDLRLATALSGLAAEYRLTIAEFTADPGAPADAVLITDVDGRPTSVPGVADALRQRLAGQEPADQPAAVTVEHGVLVVRYAAPTPPDQ